MEQIGKQKRPVEFKFLLGKPKYHVKQDVRKSFGKKRFVGNAFSPDSAFVTNTPGVNSDEQIDLIALHEEVDGGILVQDLETGSVRVDNTTDDVSEQLIGEETMDSKQFGGGMGLSRVSRLANVRSSVDTSNTRGNRTDDMRTFQGNRISRSAIRDFRNKRHTVNDKKALRQRLKRL